jgi:hypothetical protein
MRVVEVQAIIVNLLVLLQIRFGGNGGGAGLVKWTEQTNAAPASLVRAAANGTYATGGGGGASIGTGGGTTCRGGAGGSGIVIIKW